MDPVYTVYCHLHKSGLKYAGLVDFTTASLSAQGQEALV